MKKFLLIAAVLLSTVALVSASYADPESDDAAHVYVNVNPNIAVQAPTTVDLGDLQTGTVSEDITFRIDANTEAVALRGFVTKLYKGDDPTGTEVAPIDVDTSAQLPMDPANANEIQGGDGIAAYQTTGEYNGFLGDGTETLVFESSQDGHFSQDVTIRPTWVNLDNEKPQGEYSGFVVLYASVVGA